MLASTTSEEELTPVGAARPLGFEKRSTRAANTSLLDMKLLQVGAYMFIWVIGVLAAIRLLVDYGSVLKPLVLAALSVSILEWVVQTIELMQWKSWVFVILCVHKVRVLAALLAIGAHRMCLRYMKRENHDRHQQRQHELLGALRDWHRLHFPWDPIFAGRNVFFRVCAVASTLTIVVGVFFSLSAMLAANVEAFAHSSRMASYRHQFEDLVSATDAGLSHLPDRLGVLPNTTRDQLHVVIAQFQDTFHVNSTFISENQKYIVNNLKEAVGSSSTLLTEMAFYLLYTTMWLFAPLQINTDERKEKHAGQVYGLRHVWKRPVHMPVFVDGAAETSVAATAQRLPFVRRFYDTKSDPRHDLHERLYRIMQVYFSLKLLVNALFAVSLWALLFYLGVDLAILLAISCFFLSFIPELGFIISGLLPVPIILLMPLATDEVSRSSVLVRFILGIAVIKLLVSNVLESYLMGHNPTLSGAVKDHELERMKETHPVVILFFVVLAGEIWGPIGMLISVPFISFVRLMLNFWNLRNPDQEMADPDMPQAPDDCKV